MYIEEALGVNLLRIINVNCLISVATWLLLACP